MKRIGKRYWEQNYPLNPFQSVVISGQRYGSLFPLHSFLTCTHLKTTGKYVLVPPTNSVTVVV